MIKKNWKLMILTTIIIVLPMVAGLLLWNQLPEQIPTHWNAAGEVDGWSSKPFAVFFFPILLAGIHWISAFGTSQDPKQEAHAQIMVQLVLWICPVLSVLLHTIMYSVALGYGVRVEVIMPVMVGLMFMVIGNYLPKCKQNYTIGIKIMWTLADEGNWNATHRFAGWVWTMGSMVVIVTGLLGWIGVLLGVLIVMVVAPMIFSYGYYRSHRKQ